MGAQKFGELFKNYAGKTKSCVPDRLAGLVDPENESLLRVRRNLLRLAVATNGGEDTGGRRQLPDEKHHERFGDRQVGGHAEWGGLNEDGLCEGAVRWLRHKHTLPGQGLDNRG
jgi:hypothetical protein